MNLRHNLLENKKGIGTVFGMVFFLLIVMVVFASFVIVLNQNTSLEQATIHTKQMDLDRYTELQTVSINNPETAVLNSAVYLLCDITNNGTLPTEFVRLWVKDMTNDAVGNITLSPLLVLQPGSSKQYFKAVPVINASNYDQFTFWFVTTRGNLISAYPNINQFNGITTNNGFPGVTDINSTYSTDSTPMKLSLTTTKPNQLIYVVISYDDENNLYTPTSTPSLNWTNRGQSLPTDYYYYYYYYFTDGDSILETFYAIMPSAGPITINIHSTSDELSDYYCSALAFAISDVNTTSPFDGSAQTLIGKSTMPQDTITTHFSNELIIGALSIDSLNPAITPGAGFAEIMPVQSSYGASGEPDAQPRSVWSEWDIMTAPINNLSVNCTFTSSKNWAIIVDAVKLVVIPPTTPVSLSPIRGPIGQPVSVTGQGFAPNSQLIATFDGSQVPFTFTTDNSGNIPSGATFTVPQGATGTKNVTIIDSKFNYASTNFTVTPSTIIISPQIGTLGTSVTIIGSNFLSNSTITISFDGNSMTTNPSTVTANSTGGFSAIFSSDINDTAGVKQVFASDGFNSVSANFTVTPSITLSPTTGNTGFYVNVTGCGFAASQPVVITLAGSTIPTLPVSFNTNGVGFFAASFTIPNSQTAGGKTVNATDASSNSATSIFIVTPSISLSPASGNTGSSVTVSGCGFAASKTLSATFAGSSIMLSGTTSTDATGSFSGATFTVPTSTPGGAQTVQIKDASSNNATATYTVNTLTQKITVALSNSAPAAQLIINGGYPQPNTLAADGTQYSIQMVAGAPFTMSFVNGGNTRNGFNLSNVFSATSSSYTASINSISLTAYEQVQNSFSTTFTGGSPVSVDSLMLVGTYLGSGSSTIATLNFSNSWSTSAWSDYGMLITFPVSTTLSGSNARWGIISAYSTPSLTTGGNLYVKTYYQQYSFQLDYTVSNGGLPTAPTLTSTQFGSSFTPILGTSLVTYWLDSGQSWSVTNPLGGSVSNERWVSRATVSGIVSSSSPINAGTGTLTLTYYHQYYLTVTGGNSVTFGTASPTGDQWYDSGSSTTVSSNWVWGISGSIRTGLINWNLDSGSNQNPTRANSGTLTTSSVAMSGTHTVNFISTTQYYLTVTGGNSVTFGTASPTGDQWYDSGSSTTVSSNWLWNVVSGQSRIAMTSWQLDGTNNNPSRSNAGPFTTSIITMSTFHAVNFVSITQYCLTVTGGNGVTYGTASPTSDNWYDSGGSTTVSSNWVWNLVPGQSRTTITNWQLNSVNQNPARFGTGIVTTSSLTMSTYRTVNFVSTTQYYLAVNGGYSVSFGTTSPTIDQWYDLGGSTAVTSNGVYNRANGVGTRVSSWNIDGGSNTNVASTGTVATSSVSMSTYHAVTFNSVTQYQVTLDSGATSGLSTITNPTISGDNRWFDSGTSVTLILNGVYGRSSGAGTRISGYAVNGGSNNAESTTGTFTVLSAISISGLQAITTTTVTQYQVTLDATSTSALNSITSPSINSDNYWYDSGTPVIVVLNGVWGQGGGTGTRLTGYVINGGSNNPTSTAGIVTVFSGAISNHEFVTATSVTQYQVTFTQTGVDSSAGSNTVLTIGSTPYAYNTLPSSVYMDTGTTFTWASAVSVGSGKQFALTSSPSGSTITAAGIYSATYKTQYLCTFSSGNIDNDAVGAVLTLGSNTYTYSQLPQTNIWVDANTAFSYTGTVSASSGKQYVLTGTAGLSAPVVASGTATPTYKTQYNLKFAQSGLDGTAQGTIVSVTIGINSPVNVFFTDFTKDFGFVDSGTTIAYTFTSTIASSTAHKQFILTTPAPMPASSFTLTAATPVTGTYKTQYQLTVSSTHDTPTPVSGSWFDASSSVTESVTTPADISGGAQYRSTGWSGGSGGIPATGSAATVTFTISGPATITWNWQTQYLYTITSAAGTTGGQTTGYYDMGTSITSSISAIVNLTGPVVNYNTLGFTGTGNAPSSGSGTIVSFTLNQESTVTWHWNGQLILDPSATLTHFIPSVTPSGSDHSIIVSDNSNSTYVYASSTGTYSDSYSLQSIGSLSGTITSVNQYMTIQVTSISTNYATTSLTLGGVTVTSGNFTPTSINTWYTHSDTFNRPGGGTWTMTDLSNLQSGLTLHRAAGQIRCSEFWIVVNFST